MPRAREQDWNSEAKRLSLTMFKRAGFREVVRIGGDSYWKHKDGRTVIFSIDDSGKPMFKRIDKEAS